ncbi:MAG: GNAT family N-acetyltransferase [Steroidobacteraceae bacterium]
MGIQFRRVAPLDVREAVVKLFFRQRAWPYADEDEYFRYWDWRYSSMSESPAAVWIATDGAELIGHVAINFRRFQADDRDVLVGVPANFLVDERYRKMMVGPFLSRAPKKMVEQGEIDLFLGYSNEAAHALSSALGFTAIGPMHSYIDVVHWNRVLRRRSRGAALLAPVASFASRARKALGRRGRLASVERLVAHDLSAEDLRSLDRSHWKRTDGLAWSVSGAYLTNRFLLCPFRAYRVLGIVDESKGRLEGVVVTEGSTRLTVMQCDTNESVLSAVGAVEIAAAKMTAAEVVVVPLLPQTRLAAEFSKAGFMARSGHNADVVIRRTFWSAYWLPSHPAADSFARIASWKLWYGWSQH